MVAFENKLAMTCVEMVTVIGRPFSALFDSGFRNPKQKIYFTETKRNVIFQETVRNETFSLLS
jgi:hypothetical protein